MTNYNVKTAPKSLTSRLAKSSMVILVAAGLLGLVVLVFGHVNGTEFDPTNFARRQFYFIRLPGTRLQVTPVSFVKQNDPYEDHFSKHVPLPASKAKKWDVVKVHYAGVEVTGDASILTNLLSANGKDEFVWLAWSKKHPNKAKVFWPLVSEVARSGAYSVLPDLFETAASISADEQFSQMVPKKLSSLCAELAQDHLDANQFDAAIELYSLAITHDADSAGLLKRRAACFDEIGNQTNAKEDRSAAKKLTSRGSDGS